MYQKNVTLINHDCLPILMLLYIMLAYWMLFAALCNAVCLYIAFFCYWCFFFVYWHIVCLFQVWFSIMRSAFNLFVFPISMFTPFFIWKGYVFSWEIALKNNHYYCYYYYYVYWLNAKYLNTSFLLIIFKCIIGYCIFYIYSSYFTTPHRYWIFREL